MTTCNFIKSRDFILVKSLPLSSLNISPFNLKKTTLNKNIDINKNYKFILNNNFNSNLNLNSIKITLCRELYTKNKLTKVQKHNLNIVKYNKSLDLSPPIIFLHEFTNLKDIEMKLINININKIIKIRKFIKKIIKYFIIFLILIFFTYLININLMNDFIIELSSNNSEDFIDTKTENILIDLLMKQNFFQVEPQVNIPEFQKIAWQKNLPLTRNQFTVPFDFGSPSNHLIEQFGKFSNEALSNPVDPQELNLKLEELKNNQDQIRNEEFNNNYKLIGYTIMSVTVIIVAVSTIIIFNNPQIMSLQ